MLTTKQQAFVRYYLGRDMVYHGNATKSYKRAYGDCSDERVAQSSGSRLTKLPPIAALIAKYRDKAAKATQVDANFVLAQSVRVYDRAMGDEAIEVDHIDASGATVTSEIREHMPAIAVKALELIGKHTAVQAFQDNVEHTHVHRLEQALAARQRAVESKAAALPTIDGQSFEVLNDAPDPVMKGADAEQAEKRVHLKEVNRNRESNDEETRQASAGATGE